MKNKEEYTASIYAKKDALLAKRKKNIRISVSVFCIAICFCSAAIVMPKAMNKSENNSTTVPTTKTDYEINTDIYNTPYDDATEYAFLGNLDKSENVEGNSENTESGVKAEIAPETQTNKNEVFDHGAPAAKPEFGYEDSDSCNSTDSYDAPVSEPEYYTQVASHYTNDEIAEKAFSYLSDEEKKVCKNIEPFITFTHMKNGQYYSVYYNTNDVNNRTIIIELDWYSLDLITIKRLAATTKASSDSPVMTTPAYDPNKQ